MNYRPDKKWNTKKVLLLGALTVFLAYIILFTRVFDVSSRVVQFIAVPIWGAQEYVVNTWDNVRTLFLTKKSLLAENKRLIESIEIAGAKLLDRNLLFEENIELKEILGKDMSPQAVFATVLTTPNRSLYDTLIVDIGENAGVEEGDRVLYGGTIIIGKIVEVFKRSSKVLLMSSPGESLDVIVGKDNISTVAYGRGGGGFEFQLPRDAEIEIGDTIAVPGITIRVLGVVEYIKTKPSDPFKTVLFNGPVNIFKLKWVEVITDSN